MSAPVSAIAQRALAQRWRPTAFVATSMAVHAAALVAAVAGEAGWALAAVAANQAAIVLLGMRPRSTLLGPNRMRLPATAATRGEIALTFDDGPDPAVTPHVLDLLDRHGARATFFCIGERAERHPELVREIVRRGHTVENHSRGHRVTFALMGLGGIRGEIESAQRTLAELTGRAPRFFRPPAGIHSPLLDPVLHAMGLELVSWTRRGFDTRRTDAAEVVALLTQDLAAGDILLLHDGHCARTVDGQPVAIEALANLLDAARKQGLRAVTLSQAIDS